MLYDYHVAGSKVHATWSKAVTNIDNAITQYRYVSVGSRSSGTDSVAISQKNGIRFAALRPL